MTGNANGTAPRYNGLVPRDSGTSRVGTRNRRVDTGPELLLRRALWAAGVRYRLHASELPGKPDIVVRRLRIAIFCDGDFWHGRNWLKRRARLSAGWNAEYWVAKIARNR